MVELLRESGKRCRLGELVAPPGPGDEGVGGTDATGEGGDTSKPPTAEDGFAYLADQGILPAADEVDGSMEINDIALKIEEILNV